MPTLTLRISTPNDHNGAEASTSGTDILLPQSLWRGLSGRQSDAALQAAAAAHNNAATFQAEESTAAAAERHRLTNRNVVDFQVAVVWVVDMAPYLLMLGSVFALKYSLEIFQVTWLLASLMRMNQMIRRQISLKRDYQSRELLQCVAYLILNTLMLGFLTDGWWVWRLLLLIPPREESSVVSVVFQVLVADSLARFLGMLPKVVAVLVYQTAWSGGVLAPGRLRQEARMLNLLEYCLQVYRTLLPAPIWYMYLLHCTGSPALCSFVTGCYLVMKASDLARQLQLLGVAAKLVMRRGAAWGVYVAPTKEQQQHHQQQHQQQLPASGAQPQHRRRHAAGSSGAVPDVLPGATSTTGPASSGIATADHDAEAGVAQGVCPICQDAVERGVRLDCSHVFCEECISEWLERDRTCPMCRAEVKPAGLVSYGDGSTPLLPMVF